MSKQTHLKQWILDTSSIKDAENTLEVNIRSFGKKIHVLPADALQDKEHTVIGSISAYRKKVTKDKSAIAYLDNFGYADILGRVRISKLVGYIPTNLSGFYVAVRKRRILPFIILAALIAAAILAALLLLNQYSPNVDPNQKDPWTRNEQGTLTNAIEIPGYARIVVDSNNQSVALTNPQTNYAYLSYSVVFQDNTIFQSELIEPGKAVEWNVYKTLSSSPGTYNVTINISCTDPSNGAALNGATQPTPVIVK